VANPDYYLTCPLILVGALLLKDLAYIYYLVDIDIVLSIALLKDPTGSTLANTHSTIKI